MAATVAELLLGLAAAPETADHDALLFEDDRWTWREFLAESARRADRFRAVRGSATGTLRVGVLMENAPEYLFCIGGAALAGAAVVGINPTRRGQELAGDIRGVDLDLLIVDDRYEDLLAELDPTDDLGLDADRVVGTETWAASLPAEGDPGSGDQDPETLLLLTFTSGSTGAPKAVVCSTGRLALIASYNTMGLTADDVAYNAMPLFHGNALMAAWASCLASGASYAMRRSFSASGFLPDVQRFGATFFNYVGRSLAYVLAQPERPGEAETRLRFGFGTEASAHDRAEFLRRFKAPVFESYGQSEGGCYLIVGEGAPEGSLGLPQVGHDVVILDEDGNECPRAVYDADGRVANAEAAIGEIVNRAGAARFEGYYKNPEATAERVRGAAYHTGDLGYRDAEGYFWFAGRTADWMRVDSENLATAPIERLLARYPGARVVAVYALPDPVTGDAVTATLELDEGAEVSGDSLADFLDAQPDLGTKWRPLFVRVTDAMPVTATRKVDKPRLRREGWLDTGDRVLLRDGTRYRELTDADRDRLVATYAEHGRDDLLGR